MNTSHDIQVGTVYDHPNGKLKVESMDVRYSKYRGGIETEFRVRWAGSQAVRISTLLNADELLTLILECQTEEE